MTERITKTQRWLDLIALLLGRKVPLTVEEIMERVPAYAATWRTGGATEQASARRMFERDKDDLLGMGFSLRADRVEINSGQERFEGYRIDRKSFYLPYLRLISDPEAGGPDAGPGGGAAAAPYPGLPALDLTHGQIEMGMEALRRVAELPAFPFADEARSALRKLSFDVDPERFPGDAVLWVERPGAREVLERLRALSDALLARKRVRFAYHGMHRGETSERDVALFGLFFQRDWYLVGQDATRDDVRVFRVSRMERVQPNTLSPKKPDYEVPEEFELQRYLERSAWELGQEDESIATDVRFHFPLSVGAARNREGDWVRDEEGGGAVRRFHVSRTNPFLRWILSLGGEAEILTPRELREECGAMARQVAALYPEEEVGANG